MGPKQQLESDKILHAFVSRLASCSSVDQLSSASSPKAGTKRTRTPGSSSGHGPKTEKNEHGITCPGAKQLPCFLESSGKVATFSLPCFSFSERKNKFSSLTPATSTSSSSGDNASFSADEHMRHHNRNALPYENLVRPTRFNKLDISQASPTAHSNFLATFRTLLDAELRRTALALLQRSLLASRSKAKAGGQGGGIDAATAMAHASVIRSLFPNILEDLSGSSSDSSNDEEDQVVEEKPYDILASVTNWVTCSPKEFSDSTSSYTSSTKNSSLAPSLSSKKTTVTQLIVFEAVLDLSLLDSTDKTTLRLSAPGRITAMFSRFTSRIETVTVNLDCDALRAVLNAKVRDVVQEIFKMAYMYSRTAIVVGHHHSTHTSTPTPTSSMRAPISDDSSTSTSEEDLDRKMMPPPPSRRPPKNISCHINRHHQHHRKRRHVIIAKSLDKDERSSHHRPKRARMVGPIQMARMAKSA